MSWLTVEEARARFPGVWIESGALIGRGVLIGSGAQIGSEVRIGSYACIGSEVLIDSGACIDSEVCIDHGARIGSKAQIGSYAWIGSRSRIESFASIEIGAQIDSEALVHRDDRYICVFASCEGWSKTLVERDGVAWVNAGCRRFTLADARKHWADRDDRKLTRALLEGAAQAARALGLKEDV